MASVNICPWCDREIRVRRDGVLYRHDNRNNSGFCQGSFMPTVERIGDIDKVWAVKYKHGWAVYSRAQGLVQDGLTKTEAKAKIKEEVKK